MKRRLLLTAAAGTAFATLTANAQQADWPTRPVRLIVPWGAGGAADVIARTLAVKLGERWGQQVIVENKPGANTIIGAVAAAHAAPDGYTLFQPIAATMTVNPFLYSKLAYDPTRDFTLISMFANLPLIVLSSETAPGKTLLELIELGKKSPDTVTFGFTAGSQIQAETWMRDWGVIFRPIVYKSGIDVTKALLGGEIHLAVETVAGNHAHIKAGKLKGLVVNTATRMPMVPNVPTMDELKLKHTEPKIWHGLVGPAGLPTSLQSKIYNDVQAVLAMPDVNDKLVKELGFELLFAVGPSEFAEKIRAESARVAPLIKELGLKAE